jgi:hypothetical protein
VTAGTFVGNFSGSITNSINTTYAAISNNITSTNTFYPTFVSGTSGNLSLTTANAAKLSFIPSTGTLTVTNLSATTATFSGNVTSSGFIVSNVTGTNILLANGTTAAASSLMSGSYLSTSGGTVTGNVSITGTTTVNALNITGALTAGGSTGGSNQILFSNGTGVYWAPVAGVTATTITSTTSTQFGSLTTTIISNGNASLTATINPNFLYNIISLSSLLGNGSTFTLNLPSPSYYQGITLIFKFYDATVGGNNNGKMNLIINPGSGLLDNSSSTQTVNNNGSTGFTGHSIINLQANATSWWITSISNY